MHVLSMSVRSMDFDHENAIRVGWILFLVKLLHDVQNLRYNMRKEYFAVFIEC